MGQHTWFAKKLQLYLKETELLNKLDSFENDEIYLDDIELYQINHEIDELNKKNNTEYHNLFRTAKRNPDGTYCDEIIISRKECFDWIKKLENKVYYTSTKFQTKDEEEIRKKRAIEKLKEFWNKYPNGVIYFA